MLGVEPESPSQARSFRARSSPMSLVSIHGEVLGLSRVLKGQHTLPWAIHGGSRRKMVMVIVSPEGGATSGARQNAKVCIGSRNDIFLIMQLDELTWERPKKQVDVGIEKHRARCFLNDGTFVVESGKMMAPSFFGFHSRPPWVR